MAFDINAFRAQISSRGLAKPSLFYVSITLPPVLKDSLGSIVDSNTLSFFCESTSLPGMDLQLAEFKKHGFGKSYKRPIDFSEHALPAVFMVDQEFGVLKFFHRWFQAIFNYNSVSVVREDPQGKLPYEFDYIDNYSATVDIYVFSSNNIDRVYKYSLKKAFPTNISQIDVSWEINDTYMRLPVSLEFDYMTNESLELGAIRPDFSRQNGVMTYLSAINGFGQAVGQLHTPTSIQDAILQYTNINTIYGAL